MICPNCKREVPDTAKACGYCGHWLADEGETTVQVPEEPATTVARPQEKGRSPVLWIGVGLVALILIAIVVIGALALRPGRGSEADVAARLAVALAGTQTAQARAALPAEAATPEPPPPPTQAFTPEQTGTTAPGDISVYDDFNDPAHNGGYNQTQWRRSDPDVGQFRQENGRLVITHEGPPDTVALLVSREYDGVPLDAPTSFEARLQMDAEHNAGGTTFVALDFATGAEEGLWTECAIHPDWVLCAGDDYLSDGLPPEKDLWQTLRIDVDPATMEFTYYIDGRVVGSTIPPNADDLKAANEVVLFLGTRAESEETVVGYFDEVRIGPLAAARPATEKPAPVAEQAEAALASYDDFNDKAFEGDYDKSRWSLVSESPGDFVQQDGVLVVTQESAAESATRLVARDYEFVQLEARTAFEARLKLDPQERAGNLHLALEAEVPGGDEWWWTDCTISEDWLGCYADLGFQPEGVSVQPGTWHTVRIEVDPATLTFTYYLDGQVQGTFVPPNAEKLKDAEFALTVGIWHDEREDALVGYIDDVRVGQLE